MKLVTATQWVIPNFEGEWCQTYTFDKIAFFTCDGIVKSVGLTPTRSDPNEIHSVILGSREFVDEIKERFLRGKQPDRELVALRDMTNRPGLDDLEQVVNLVLQTDEKLARQVKLYLCHPYSGKSLREIGERYCVSSESGVTQASRRIQLKQKNDKRFGKLITKTVKKLALSNV